MHFKQLFHPFAGLKERREARKNQEWLTRNTWEGLVQGDTIGYKGKSLMYLGMSKMLHMNGPGGFGFNEPVFIDPKAKPMCLYYIRSGRDLPAAFSEDAEPAGMDGTALRVGFLNSDPALAPDQYRKTGHISVDEWNRMLTCSEPIRK